MASWKNVLFNKPNGSLFKQKLLNVDAVDGQSVYPYSYVRNGAVMIVPYLPVIGDCNHDFHNNIGSPSAATPFNANLSVLYTYLRGKSFTLGNYTAADVGKCLIALDSLYGLLSELDVDINALSCYEYNNNAYRGMLQDALWRDYKTAQKNIANLITRRNNIVDKLKAIPYVPGIKYLQDHIDWAKYVYKDDNLDKSSLILFRRVGYYRWCLRPTDAYPGALLISDNTNGTAYTALASTIIYAEDKFDILEMLINDYILDDDMLNLSSGIAAGFGIDVAQYKIPYLPEDTTKFKLEVKYDLDIIDSLRNADFSPLEAGTSIIGIDEDTSGNLMYSTALNAAPSGNFPVRATISVANTNPTRYRSVDTGESRVLFSYEDNPTEESIKTLAAFVHDYTHVNPTDIYSLVYGLKCEYITSLKIYYLDDNNQIGVSNFNRFVSRGVGSTSIDYNIEILLSFNSAPIMYQFYADGSGVLQNIKSIHYPKDIDNLGELPRSANTVLSESYMWDKFCRFGSRSGKFSKNKKDSKDTE